MGAHTRQGRERQRYIKDISKANGFKLLIWASLSSLGIQAPDARRPNTNNQRAACFDKEQACLDNEVYAQITVSFQCRKSLFPFESQHNLQTH